MQIVINEENLSYTDITSHKKKVRALLFNDELNVLVVRYGGTILLPGGVLSENESAIDGIIRELHEKTGIVYEKEELRKMLNLKEFRKKYYFNSKKIPSELVETTYFIGKFKGLELANYKTKYGKLDYLDLELCSLEELKNYIGNSENIDLKHSYFKDETLLLLSLVEGTKNAKTKRLI